MMNTKTKKVGAQDMIEGTAEAWDEGILGTDEEYIAVSDLGDEDAIDEALELQPISIRLQKSLIEDFKIIANFHGISYQPLMRQQLKRFADCEMKRLLRKLANEQRTTMEENKESEAKKKVA